MKKILLLAVLTLAQRQAYAEPAAPAAPAGPVAKPNPVNTANRATPPAGEKSYLVLAGLGSEGEDLNLILVQVSRNLFYSFKYCSNKTEDKSGLFQKVRSTYMSDADNEENNAIAAQLFDSSSCEVITKSPVYAIHLDAEDPLSKSAFDGEEKSASEARWRTRALVALLPVSGLLVSGIYDFTKFRANKNTISFFRYLRSEGVPGRLRMGLAFLLAAADTAAFYHGVQSEKEYHALSMIDQFVNRNGRLLQVDDKISSVKALLESALPQAAKDGYISIL